MGELVGVVVGGWARAVGGWLGCAIEMNGIRIPCCECVVELLPVQFRYCKVYHLVTQLCGGW